MFEVMQYKAAAVPRFSYYSSGSAPVLKKETCVYEDAESHELPRLWPQPQMTHRGHTAPQRLQNVTSGPDGVGLE